MAFLEKVESPNERPSIARCHRHHILPRAMFPEFISFKKHPWNCKALSPANHLVAHYFLYRAMPKQPVAYLTFLKMSSRGRFNSLVQGGFDPIFLREISEAYARICMGIESIEGWLHIYKGKSSHIIVPREKLNKYLEMGWTQTAPPRQWVFQGNESSRVLLEEVQDYLARGWQLGRTDYYTEDMRQQKSKDALFHHENEKLKGPNAYSYMPRREQHWAHGQPRNEETRAKISKTLTGVPKPPDHPAHKGLNRGMHWEWSEEARRNRSELMKGKPVHSNLSMKDRTHSEETRQLMSEAHYDFYANDSEGVARLNAARPRGENHIFFGKERDAETRALISQSLTGKKQSDNTKKKRSKSLALAKMPDYTEEEQAIFKLLMTEKNEKSFYKLAKTLKRPAAKRVAAGLKIMVLGKATPENYRYWRQAEAWKQA